jgi:hypothetical protein
VVEKLRNFALHPEIEEHGTGSGDLLVPVGLGVGLELLREKLRLAVVQIRGGDHKVGVEGVLDPVGVLIGHTGRVGLARTLLGGDDRHSRLGQDRDAVIFDHGPHGINDPGESPLGIEHAVLEVQVGHQVEHAGGDIGG